MSKPGFLDWAGRGFTAELVRVCAWNDQGVEERYRGKKPAEPAWEKREVTLPVVTGWARMNGANVGLRTRAYPAVDIDVDDAGIADACAGLVADELGVTSIRRRGNSPRRVLLYRLAGEPFKKSKVEFTAPDGTEHMVEFLAEGQQVVVAGRHSSGADLEWTPSPPKAAELPELTAEKRDALAAKIRDRLVELGCTVKGAAPAEKPRPAPQPRTRVTGGDEELARQALDRIDPDLAYDEWIKIGQALHAKWPEAGGTGFSLWDGWSSRGSKYPGAEELEAKWRSFRAGGGITFGTLLHEGGVSGRAPSGNSTVPRPAPSAPEPDGSEPETDVGEAGEVEECHPEVAALNRDWFVLDEMGSIFACRFIEEHFPGGQTRRVLVRYSFPDFRRKLENRVIREGRRNVTLGDAWLKWSGRRQFDRAVFDPTTTDAPPGVLNLWRGWAVEPCPGDWSLLRRHIDEVICGGNPTYADYLFGWLADLFQFPARMPGVAPVLRGPEGVGKSFLGLLVRRIAGQHGMLVKDPRQVVGNFNAHLRDLIFLEAGEAMFAGDRRDGDRLKALVTDEVVAIESKGVNAFQAPSRIHLLMTTNADWAVPAGAQSRRYFVLDVGRERMNDAAYWDRLFAAAEDDAVVGAMLHDLLARDLSGFNVRRFPVTEALLDQRARTATGIVAWALDLAEREALTGDDGYALEWEEFVPTRLLYSDYCRWVARRRYESVLAQNIFAKDIQSKLGLSPCRPRADQPGGRVTGYVLGPVGKFRDRAETAAGVLVRVEGAEPPPVRAPEDNPDRGNTVPERPGQGCQGGPGSEVAPRDEFASGADPDPDDDPDGSPGGGPKSSSFSSSSGTLTTLTTLTDPMPERVSVVRVPSPYPDHPDQKSAFPSVLEVLRRHTSASMPMLLVESGLAEDVVRAELDLLNATSTGGFWTLPDASLSPGEAP